MTPEKHISLAELLANVKQSLTERFPFGIWISAELGEVKLNRYSGHCYLELIEKGDKDGTPKAKASAAHQNHNRAKPFTVHSLLLSTCQDLSGCKMIR